jgi:hypothetical protein
MMSTNPYQPFLGGRDPVEAAAATPTELARLVDAIGPGRLNWSPAPGKWSARDILCHLADTEIAFAFRLRQALAEDHHVIQPFDQEAWARPYSKLDARMALDVFTAVRGWNLKLICSVIPEALSKPLTHPERGAMTFQTLLETMGGHDLNHLKQVQAIASAV